MRSRGIPTFRRFARTERRSRKTRNSKLSPHQDNCQLWLLLMIRGSRLTLSAVHREFIRRVTLARTRQTGIKSKNCFASSREFALQMMGVALDFAVWWRSRVTAISSEPSKEQSKEESLTKHEATPDSATTRFSFLMDSSKRSVNCPGSEEHHQPSRKSHSRSCRET